MVKSYLVLLAFFLLLSCCASFCSAYLLYLLFFFIWVTYLLKILLGRPKRGFIVLSHIYKFISLSCYFIIEDCIQVCNLYCGWEILNWQINCISVIERVAFGIEAIWCVICLKDSCAENELICCCEISTRSARPCCLFEIEMLSNLPGWNILNTPTIVNKLYRVINCYLKWYTWTRSIELTCIDIWNDNLIFLLISLRCNLNSDCRLMVGPSFSWNEPGSPNIFSWHIFWSECDVTDKLGQG